MTKQQRGQVTEDLPDQLRSAGWKRRFQRRLLSWFARHARELPWRGTHDPYQVWVSEIMLQQTQVVTVVPYFERFMQRFPSIQSLSEASEQEVLRHWEGLGYYRRARQLHQAARQLAEQHAGQFPTKIDQVRALPGIGRYTAGAILSIACGQRHPILEANTVRVLSRLVAFRGDPTRSAGQRYLWSVAETILPRTRPGDFNQALMELGSEICTPRQPACDVCPVMQLCLAYDRQLQQQIPVPKAKLQYQPLREAAVVIRQQGTVLVRRCQSGERWAGLWDFPRFEVSGSHDEEVDQELIRKVAELTGLSVVPSQRFATLNHSVTRFRIRLECYQASCTRPGPMNDQQRWVNLCELATMPLSVTGRKISHLLDKD